MESLSQSDVVVYGVKNMILTGELGPGDRLPIEIDLAKRLHVSRSSLREGVRALSIMGVLETRQGAGTFVTKLDASLLAVPMGFLVDLQRDSGARTVLAVRRLLETEAAALAATNADANAIAAASDVLDQAQQELNRSPVSHEDVLDYDVRFHRIIASASGNPVLAALIDALASRTVRERLWRGITQEGAEIDTVAEHRAILRAISNRSADHARLRMATHLIAVEEYLSDVPPEGLNWQPKGLDVEESRSIN